MERYAQYIYDKCFWSLDYEWYLIIFSFIYTILVIKKNIINKYLSELTYSEK